MMTETAPEDREPIYRYRQKHTTRAFGGYSWVTPWFPPSHSYGNSLTIRRQWTGDYYNKPIREDGSIAPSDFDSTTSDALFSTASGKAGYYEIKGHPSVAHHCSSYPLSEPWNSKDLGDAVYTAQLLAATSPFRSTVSVPILIAELAEGASLLKVVVKDGFLPLVGSTYLNYKFGWSTLLNDVATLYHATDLLLQRVKEFDSLYKKGGLRRRVKLDTYNLDSWTSQDKVLSGSSWHQVRGTITETYRTKVWGSLRWKATDAAKLRQDEFQSQMHAFKQIFDLEAPDPHTIWEAIPFSWLIDYFADISTVFASYEGREFVEPYDICIMRERTTTGSATISSETGVAASFHGNMKRVQKLRSVVTEEPSDLSRLHTKYPSWKQVVTILALLATLKGRWR